MDDIFDELELQMSIAKSNMKDLKYNLKTLKNELNIKEEKDQMPTTYEHVLSEGPKCSFPKSKRFREPDVDDSMCNQSFYSQTTTASLDLVKKKTSNVVFPQSQRFESVKQIDYIAIDPNYDYVKRNTKKSVVIKKSEQPQVSQQIEYVGPGSYEPNYDVTMKSQKVVTVSKSARWQIQKTAEFETVLNPNYDLVRPHQPTAVIREQTKRNEKLLQRDYASALEQIDRIQRYLNMPLEIDKFRKPNVAVHKLRYDERKRKIGKNVAAGCDLFKIRQGDTKTHKGSDQVITIQTKNKIKCMVVYRSVSPKRWKKPENLPGPAHYYAKDDMVHERVPQYSFSKQERIKKIKLQDLDLRTPLHIDVKQVKKRWPVALIFPEGPPKKLKKDEIYKVWLGPGAYNESHKLTEQRNDKGVVSFNKQTTREENDQNRAEQFDNYLLNPNYDFDKPSIKGNVKLHQDTEHYAMYPSDQMMNPEKWNFYDFDLDKIRFRGFQASDFAGGILQQDFMDHEEHRELFSKYLAQQEKRPQIGQYNLQYSQQDKHFLIADFKRQFLQEPRNQQPIQKIDKDELILNPDKAQKRLPDYDFKKMLSRPEDKIQDEKNLDLNVQYNLVDKKVINLVNMDKQLDRVIEKEPDQNPILLSTEIVQKEETRPEPFSVQLPRPELKVDDLKNIIEPNMNAVKPKTVVGVKMNKGAARFKEMQKDKLDPQNLPTEAVIDLTKNYDAIKGKSSTVGFAGQSGRENPKSKLKQEEEELKKQKILEQKKLEDSFRQKNRENLLKYQQQQQQQQKKTNTNNQNKIDKQINKRIDKDLSPWEQNDKSPNNTL